MRNVDNAGSLLDTLLERDVGQVQLLKLGFGRLATAARGSSVVALHAQVSCALPAIVIPTPKTDVHTQATPLGSTIHKLGPPSSSIPPTIEVTPKGRTLE